MRWTDKDFATLSKMCDEGTSAREVAKILKRTVGSITSKIQRCGLQMTSSPGARPMNHIAKQKTVEERSREEALKGKLREVKTYLKKALLKVATLSEIRELIASSCEPLKPLPSLFTPVIKKTKHSKQQDVFPAVALISDWQIGERISKEESGGWGSYDYEIAVNRAMKYAQKIVEWVKTQRYGYHIKKLRIFVLGDMVSGNIHDELRETNEWPAPVASVKAGDLLAQVLLFLAPHFELVEADFIGPDNHGRLTKRVRFKLAAEDSFNYIVFAVAQARLANDKRIILRLQKANPAYLDLEGSGILAMHGHGIKAWMGIPFYGMQRMQGRKAKVHMEQERPFKLMISGHWHAPAELYGIIINGCLSGTTELDHTVGRYAPPSQTSFLWHPKHGVFNKTDWYL